MRNIILRIFINTAALWVVDKLFQDIWFQDTGALILTAIVFGLLNTFIKPILVIFTLPINLLSLGLFTIVINALILKLADYWIDDFVVDGFGTAIFASLFISIISIILNSILKDK
ncbi:MAG: phage holin family protein [Calditrichaeota bacterium]|nr:MAG: phage holin family protein [Calditrichota bacterium]MBL1205485.1 phage holin family protein [Calditrichota bacterium]NOG45313.1 phage holin family protein [Calditrichota bacterium]